MFKKHSSLSCLQKSIELLSKREYSEYQLKNKLLQYGYSIEEIDVTLIKLQEKNWQSNTRFIEYIARKHSSKSINKLNYELKQHNLNDEEKQIAKNMLEQTGSEYDRALQAWYKKFANRPISHNEDINQQKTKKNQQKQIRFLLSQGFSYEVIMKVLKNINENNEIFEDE